VAGAVAKAQAHGSALAASCPGARIPGTPTRRTLYLGWPVDVARATLVSARPGGTVPAGRPLRIGLVAPDGTTSVPKEAVVPSADGWSVTFARPEQAVGIVVEGPARAVSETSTVSSATGGRWALSGAYQDPVDTRAWRYAGTYAGTFAVFKRTGRVRPAVWLAGHALGSSVRQVSRSDWGTTVDHVVAARPVTVVWSETYFPGWHATVSPAGGAPPAVGASARRGAAASLGGPRTLTVRRLGLLQSVRVPAGDWTLTFRYKPRLLVPGEAGTLLALAGFGALGLTALRELRRRRAGVAAARGASPGHTRRSR
jgi:hypothetical protein